ncbi:hypothetical protein JOQ06_024101 [Pogonophryne albipinna]|uniref:DUF4371 domain-containing protein n=1 Tax=Pogonophryne albipinna TaxID=1090488 RepID=A0AAD6BJX8_9TELE|nr:hypothetical protein JOQ06_024101 [Pogonophryne albipinna]
MAPSNNLTSSRTITEAGEDFAKLLATACSRWPNVFALDFPPRLTVDPDYQDMMRQEFRRVAARVKYTPIAEYFPSKELDLWSRDGVHLIESAGMPILVGSIWNAAYMQLVPAEPTPSPVVHRRSPPARRVTPRVIVKGEVAKSPQLDPSKWTVIGQGRKRSQHDEPEQSIDALKQAGTVQQEELEESYLPLTPVWFSSAVLVEMDKISPSHLPGPDECTPPVPKRQKKAKMELKQRAPASKRTLAMRQGEAAPMVVEVILRPPTSRGTVAVEQQVEPFPGVEPLPGVEPSLSVEPSPSNEPSPSVIVDVDDDNRWRTALADAEPETFFWELIELDGTTADDITKALMECLGRDFNEDFLGQCFVSFACDGASVMLGKRTGVATQLCSKFPSLFVWHCSNHRLELAVGDVVKEVSGLNHFQIFFDKLYSLFHQRQLAQCAQAVGQRLLVIGRVLSIRWVASSERSVRAVWENYRVLHDHFTNAANDTSRDSRDRAKYKGLDDVLTSATFVSNLGLMYDALTELSDLSRQLQKREMTLPTADRLLTREIRVFESMVTMPGPHMTTVHTALAEKSFKGVALRENGRLVQIHAGHKPTGVWGSIRLSSCLPGLWLYCLGLWRSGPGLVYSPTSSTTSSTTPTLCLS